jgi:hypothetical protein
LRRKGIEEGEWQTLETTIDLCKQQAQIRKIVHVHMGSRGEGHCPKTAAGHRTLGTLILRVDMKRCWIPDHFSSIQLETNLCRHWRNGGCHPCDFVFTKENAATLIPILNAAFTSNVKNGLLLFRKHRKQLEDGDWQSLVFDLVRRFDRSLDGFYDEVIAHVLELLLANTRRLGDDECALLGNTLEVKVLLMFAQISRPEQIGLIRGVADLAAQCTSTAILSNLYQFVFLTTWVV